MGDCVGIINPSVGGASSRGWYACDGLPPLSNNLLWSLFHTSRYRPIAAHIDIHFATVERIVPSTTPQCGNWPLTQGYQYFNHSVATSHARTMGSVRAGRALTLKVLIFVSHTVQLFTGCFHFNNACCKAFCWSSKVNVFWYIGSLIFSHFIGLLCVRPYKINLG